MKKGDLNTQISCLYSVSVLNRIENIIQTAAFLWNVKQTSIITGITVRLIKLVPVIFLVLDDTQFNLFLAEKCCPQVEQNNFL